MLSPEERKTVEERLRQERERALQAIGEFEKNRETSLLEETGELTMYRLHPADVGSETMEQEQQFMLASVEGRRLYEIDDALRRLYAEPERFGTCANCGRDIGMERLEIVPYATLCARCQAGTEDEPEQG